MMTQHADARRNASPMVFDGVFIACRPHHVVVNDGTLTIGPITGDGP